MPRPRLRDPEAHVINLPSLGPAPEGSTTPEEVRVLGSHNWHPEADIPTILVPGCPRMLELPRQCPRVARGKEIHFIDENHFRQEDYPLEALFRSVSLMTPDFDFQTADVVSDRSNLRKLLAAVCGTKHDPFEIKGQRVGNMLALVQSECSDCSRDNAYGFNFEAKITKQGHPSCPGSYRSVVTYTTCGLRLVVRCEMDAYMDSSSSNGRNRNGRSKTAGAANLGNTSPAHNGTSATKPAPSLKRHVDALPNSQPFEHDSVLHYLSEGHFVDWTGAVEIKTRSEGSPMKWDDIWGQLYLSCIPNLVVGYHRQGVVSSIGRYKQSEVQKSAGGNLRGGADECIRRFAALLRAIKLAVSSFETDKFEITFSLNDTRKLHVRPVAQGDCAPPALLAALRGEAAPTAPTAPDDPVETNVAPVGNPTNDDLDPPADPPPVQPAARVGGARIRGKRKPKPKPEEPPQHPVPPPKRQPSPTPPQRATFPTRLASFEGLTFGTIAAMLEAPPRLELDAP